MAQSGEEASGERTSLAELAWLFFRLGATSFGGPAAHVAMMRDEVVTRRRWLDEAAFLDRVSVTNLIPGPNSTELALLIGRERRGLSGLVVAGVAFLLPAMVLTASLGWLYVRYGRLPEVAGLLFGVKPAILAVVVQALAGLVPTALRSSSLRLIAFAVLASALIGVSEVASLGSAGLAAVLVARIRGELRFDLGGKGSLGLAPLAPVIAAVGVATAATPATLFEVFFRIGSALFGSGYVLLAFLRSELVGRLGWIGEPTLLDAVAVGQVTPGPVFTTATFLGYVLAGPAGALAATVGIFLPAFLLVALSGAMVPRLRSSRFVGVFLDGLNAGSLGLMASAALTLSRGALQDPLAVALAAVSCVLLLRFRVNATWVVLGAGLVGALAHFGEFVA